VRRPRQGFGFEEVARRHGDFALAAVAATVTLDSAGNIEHATLAASSGRCAERISSAEETLFGEAPTEETLRGAGAAAALAADPVADIHAEKDYRRHLVGVIARRALTKAVNSARQDMDG